MRFGWVVLLLLLAWAVFGRPASSIAGWFWGESAAPWESVDAFYYPDRSSLSKFESRRDLSSIEECRAWVASIAARHNDAGIQRGIYECGVGYLEDFGGLRVYRVTTR